MAETTFVIPDGYELRQTGDNQYSIVKKEEPVQQQNSFFSDSIVADYNEEKPTLSQNIVNAFKETPSYQQPGTIDNVYYSQKEQAKEKNLYSDIKSASAYSNAIPASERDRLFEERYGGDYSWLKEEVRSGRLRLTQHEMNLLRFCDSIDVKEFLKEEFRRHPINIRGDENGNIWVDKTPVGN